MINDFNILIKCPSTRSFKSQACKGDVSHSSKSLDAGNDCRTPSINNGNAIDISGVAKFDIIDEGFDNYLQGVALKQ